MKNNFWHKSKQLFSKLKWLIAIGLTIILLIVIVADYAIEKSTDAFVYNDINTIPYHKTGLLLGTSKHVKSGNINHYYKNRITATVALYKAKKIDFIVISGDNSKDSYNEPEDMRNDLRMAVIEYIKNGGRWEDNYEWWVLNDEMSMPK